MRYLIKKNKIVDYKNKIKYNYLLIFDISKKINKKENFIVFLIVFSIFIIELYV